jgi:hypothetical protein
MPTLSPPRQQADQVASLLVNHFGAVRLGIGWHVARQAGISTATFGHHPLVGWDVLAKWDQAKRLPPDLKQLEAAGRLYYRIRLLALALSGDPLAEACGGPEQWWQLCLAEDLLGDIGRRLMVDKAGKASAPPRNRAAVIWWLRRGVNPMSPSMEPGTWALVEAAQQRLFPSRTDMANQGDALQPLIDLPFLNGQRSLAVRRQLLRDLTGRPDGLIPNRQLELYRDWDLMLTTWSELAKAIAKPTRRERREQSRPTYLTPQQREHQVGAAIAIHDTFLPGVWAQILAVRAAIQQKHLEKPSDCNGFQGQKQIQPTGPAKPFPAHQSGADFTHQQKTGSGRQAPTKPASPDLLITTPRPIDSAVNNSAHQREAQL